MSADDTAPVGGSQSLDDGISIEPEESGTASKSKRAADGEQPVELPLDQVFEMVKNERRRLTIKFLRERGDEITLGTLAEHIASIENDKPVKAISSKERKRAYVGLYQCHLPKMNDLDIVDFNQDRGLVRLGPNAERLFPYIDPDPAEQSVEWPGLYLGLAAIGGVLLVLSASGLTPAALGPGLVAAGLVAAVGACSVAQLWTDRSK